MSDVSRTITQTVPPQDDRSKEVWDHDMGGTGDAGNTIGRSQLPNGLPDDEAYQTVIDNTEPIVQLYSDEDVVNANLLLDDKQPWNEDDIHDQFLRALAAFTVFPRGHNGTDPTAKDTAYRNLKRIMKYNFEGINVALTEEAVWQWAKDGYQGDPSSVYLDQKGQPRQRLTGKDEYGERRYPKERNLEPEHLGEFPRDMAPFQEHWKNALKPLEVILSHIPDAFDKTAEPYRALHAINHEITSLGEDRESPDPNESKVQKFAHLAVPWQQMVMYMVQLVYAHFTRENEDTVRNQISELEERMQQRGQTDLLKIFRDHVKVKIQAVDECRREKKFPARDERLWPTSAVPVKAEVLGWDARPATGKIVPHPILAGPQAARTYKTNASQQNDISRPYVYRWREFYKGIQYAVRIDGGRSTIPICRLQAKSRTNIEFNPNLNSQLNFKTLRGGDVKSVLGLKEGVEMDKNITAVFLGPSSSTRRPMTVIQFNEKDHVARSELYGAYKFVEDDTEQFLAQQLERVNLNLHGKPLQQNVTGSALGSGTVGASSA